MKKTLTIAILLLSLIIILAGCSGGSGSPSPTNKVTSVFQIIDVNDNPIQGFYANYTEPDGTTINSPKSDASGKLTIISTKVGVYTINYTDYNGVSYISDEQGAFVVTPTMLELNREMGYTIRLDHNKHTFSITQTYVK